jgi:hypothetical protein
MTCVSFEKKSEREKSERMKVPLTVNLNHRYHNPRKLSGLQRGPQRLISQGGKSVKSDSFLESFLEESVLTTKKSDTIAMRILWYCGLF